MGSFLNGLSKKIRKFKCFVFRAQQQLYLPHVLLIDPSPFDMLTVKDLDVDFLPQIHDIVRIIEKEVNESGNPSKGLNRENQNDVSLKIQNLKERFAKFRETVRKVEGINVTSDEQEQLLQSLNIHLSAKRELLVKYKHGCPIDVAMK